MGMKLPQTAEKEKVKRKKKKEKSLHDVKIQEKMMDRDKSIFLPLYSEIL